MIINQFFRGVDRDTAPEGVAADRARDARNLRLTTIGGKGMIMTSIKGNEEVFALSDGFLPLGHATFQGISIVFSVNTSTGEGEIGSFPSPAVGGGFERIYRPLQNFTGSVDPRNDPSAARLPFRTTCLGFECDHQIDAEARISYDGSIEVFWTDFLNRFRHVSSGFRASDGTDTSRLYWHGNDGTGEPECASLLNQINVLFESCGRPSATISIVAGGSLMAGNWFFYPRYLRPDFSATSFLSSIGPVQVSEDPISDGATVDGNVELFNTGKKVILSFSNIDSGYELLEIGFSYHHGTTFDTGLFSQQFSIPPGATTFEIEITGQEDIIDLTSAELTTGKSNDDTVRSLAQTENRLWGANWKSSLRHLESLRPIAQAVVASAPLPGEIIGIPDWRIDDASIPYQYKDYQQTYDHVGYFRGEPYAFAVVFVLTDGGVLPPTPMTGTDHWTGTTTPSNDNGVVRFPTGDQSDYSIWAAGDARVMGVKFDTSAAAIPPEVASKICGFYFVRAERKPQLFYQGMATSVWHIYDGDIDNMWERALEDPYGTESHATNPNKNIASLKGDNYAQVMDVPWRATRGGNEYAGVYDNAADDIVKRRAGLAAIFSADHFFVKSFTDGSYYLRNQGSILFRVEDLYPQNIPFPGPSLIYLYAPSTLYDQVGYSVLPIEIEDVTVVNVKGDEPTETPVGSFVSRFEEGNADHYNENEWFRIIDSGTSPGELGNREIRQRNYLGLSKSGIDTTLAQDGIETAKLVNIYKYDPLSIDPSVLYSPGTELYFRIGKFRPISDWGGSFIEYHGDCFLQRTYFKHCYDRGFHEPSQGTDGYYGGIDDINYPVSRWAYRYTHGNLVGFVSENSINIAMRYRSSSAKYFPGDDSSIANAAAFITAENEFLEAENLNRGYNRTLDLRGDLGDDALVPPSLGWHPTRIRYSERYVNESTTRDGYLIWGLDNYKDFDHHPGEMMAIEVLNGNLYSVQRHAMRRHFIAERYLNQGPSGGARFVLGDGETLSDRSDVISGEVGTQHQWSVIKTDSAIYGIDFSLRTAWRFAGDGFSPFSENQLFHSDVYELIEARSGEFSDSSIISGDSPVCNEGIVGWYDRKHREIGWSFLWAVGEGRYSESFVYDEKSNSYMGKRYGLSNAHSPYYLTINEDMYSLDPASVPWSPGTASPSFWLHGHNSLDSEFWGLGEIVKLSVVINPSSTKPKIYDNAQLSGSDVAMREVNFRTEFQSSSLDPFISNPLFWLEPRYKENMWHFTIPKTVAIASGPNQEYQVKSPLRGKWMEAEFIWESTLPINIRSLNSFLRESLQ